MIASWFGDRKLQSHQHAAVDKVQPPSSSASRTHSCRSYRSWPVMASSFALGQHLAEPCRQTSPAMNCPYRSTAAVPSSRTAASRALLRFWVASVSGNFVHLASSAQPANHLQALASPLADSPWPLPRRNSPAASSGRPVLSQALRQWVVSKSGEASSGCRASRWCRP